MLEDGDVVGDQNLLIQEECCGMREKKRREGDGRREQGRKRPGNVGRALDTMSFEREGRHASVAQVK